MTWEAVVLAVVLVPILWTLLGTGSDSPRLPAVAAPARAADVVATADDDEAAVRPARPAPALEALDGPAVVSLEPLAARPVPRRTAHDAEPGRAEEHARFRRKVAAPAQTDHPSEAAPFLDARELRRSLLMVEVLGPPRALRPLEEDRWG